MSNLVFQTAAENRAAQIMRSHEWGECLTFGDHCHCLLQVRTLRTGTPHTCATCD
jgi:hypothetical protein